VSDEKKPNQLIHFVSTLINLSQDSSSSD